MPRRLGKFLHDRTRRVAAGIGFDGTQGVEQLFRDSGRAIEVLRQARSSDTVWKQVPFIVLTTSRENSDIDAAYRLGVNSYIVKPVDFLAFADVAKTIKVYWLLTNEPPFPEGKAG